MATADTVRDRRQARDERGVRSNASVKGGGDRLPSPPRERKPALAALAVLLIVGGAAVAGLLAMRMDERAPVLAAATDIPVGTELTADMFTTTQVASDTDTLIPESQLDQLIGRHTSVEIYAGQLIDTRALEGSGWLGDDRVAVGALLPAGRLPANGLESGDVVTLVRVDDEGDGEPIVEGARVSTTDDGSSGSGGSGAVVVTLIVSPDQAPQVAGVAAAGELAIVLVSRGAPLEDEEE